MLTDNHLLNQYNTLLRIILIFVWSTINHLSLWWLLFTNFWVMAQANCLHQNLNSKVLWMVKKLQLFTGLMKLGTVFLDRLLQHIKNVRLIQWDFIYHFLKTFKKFFFQNTPNKKDGILYTLNGLILSLVVWRDLFILMLRVKNGYKLTLEPHMQLWRFLNNKKEFLKLKKQKRTENHIFIFIWVLPMVLERYTEAIWMKHISVWHAKWSLPWLMVMLIIA